VLPDFSKLGEGLKNVETFGVECLAELRAIRALLETMVQQQKEKDDGK
jgi:hypothetical protein